MDLKPSLECSTAITHMQLREELWLLGRLVIPSWKTMGQGCILALNTHFRPHGGKLKEGTQLGSRFPARGDSWSNLAHTWVISRAAKFLAIGYDCHHLPTRVLVSGVAIIHPQTHWLQKTNNELSLTFSLGQEFWSSSDIIVWSF